VSDSASIVLTGRAYQRRATLEIRGDTLMWRAQKGQVYSAPENIATSVHDVKNVMWLERRGTLGGAGLAVLALLSIAQGYIAAGVATFALALLYIVWRFTHPSRFLGLELGGRWFVLRVDPTSADEAKALVDRIEKQLLTGESPEHPPALP
jgi:hypothetical protein